jgi:hypothetical protein
MGRIRTASSDQATCCSRWRPDKSLPKPARTSNALIFLAFLRPLGHRFFGPEADFVGICGSCSLVAIRSFRRRLRQPTKSDICILMGPALPIRHGLAHGSFWSLPSASLRLHVLSSLSTFIRSLTWIFSSERTAFLIFWRDLSVALPAASLSNFASISLQVKGRFEPPG